MAMSRAVRWQWTVAATALAFTMGIGLFCPRYVLWRGLDLPPALHHPEINRAHFALQQIEDPFAPIASESNRAMRWRLFFPILAHYTGLKPTVFFALPFIGCLLALSLITHVVLRETASAALALLSTVLAATTSWFFVATGWLAYFDGWYILGLVAVCAVRGRGVLVASCLIVAWIDERFVVALPLALALRAALLDWRYREAVLALALVAPYILFRAVMVIAAQDENSATHVKDHLAVFSLGNEALLSGLWHGLRAGWLLVAACMALLFRYGIRYALVAGLAAGVALLVNSVLAWDYSRNVSVLLPCMLVGILLLARWRLNRALAALALALAVNLLAPAKHVNAAFSLDIENVWRERMRENQLPDTVNPVAYNMRAIELADADDVSGAKTYFTYALALAESYPGADAYFVPDVYWNRATLYLRAERWADARADLVAALACAPADWQQRHLAEEYAAGMAGRNP